MTSLRQATQAQHAQIERALDLTGRPFTLAAYRQLLARFYGFYEPLEARLSALPDWRGASFEFALRRKTHLLARDLQSLGLSATDINALPRCRALPCVASFGHALGCLYVLEGATLGGRILARHFHQTLGLTADNGAAFYAGYGSETGARWQEFGACATACATSDERAAAMLAAAQETFTKLQQWLTRAEPNS